MSDESPDVATPIVHALLVCRSIEAGEEGQLSLKNVVEVIPLDKVPGDVGPLTFVAFVRNLPAGEDQVAFVLRAPDQDDPVVRLPLDVNVPAGLADRQVAVQVTVPSMPVSQGGWIEYYFEWRGQALAANRFAVGAKR